MKIINQQGNTTLFSMLILTTILSILLFSMEKILINYNDHLSAQQAFRCLKNYNMKQRKYIALIGSTNKLIKTISIGAWASKLISLIIPGLVIVKATTQKALSALKKYQALETLKYLSYKVSLYKNKCFVINNNLPHYYELNGFKLKRDKLGLTILRRKKWYQKIIARKVTFKTQVTVQSIFSKVMQKSTMLNIGLKGAAY